LKDTIKMGISEVAKAVCHVERNLKCLADMPRVATNNIRDFRGAFKRKQRVGRGGDRGKTSGKGHKGQGQRGTKPRIGFEGGQTPFYRLVPKHGFTNALFKNQFTPIHLNKLQYFIDAKRIDPTQKIDMEVLHKSGAIGRVKDGVRLLGGGATWFQSSIDIEVTRASQNAIQAVERNGGRVQAVYHDQVAIRVALNPEKYKLDPPKRARPSHKNILWYSDPVNRGFLADPEKVEELRQENLKLGKVTDQLADIKI